LDHCVRKEALALFGGIEVAQASEFGWNELSNGALLKEANSLFDVLVTVDQKMQHQSSLKGLTICVAILKVHGNFQDQVAHAIRKMLDNQTLQVPGEFVVIEI
jgi:hypothetical protein